MNSYNIKDDSKIDSAHDKVESPKFDSKRTFYNTLKTDDSMEKDGIVLDYGELGRIKIARAGGGNRRFAKAVEAKFRPYRRQIQTGSMDDKQADKLLIEVFAETVVLGWEGVCDENGDEMKFSKENCAKLLTEVKDLFFDIRDQAQDAANFRQVSIEEDVKN